MNVISEAEACRWLGRRVSLLCEARPVMTGRLRHVSSRSAFLLEDDCNVQPIGGTIRLVPLAVIARIVPAVDEETGQ
jgi:hypothetical protein